MTRARFSTSAARSTGPPFHGFVEVATEAHENSPGFVVVRQLRDGFVVAGLYPSPVAAAEAFRDEELLPNERRFIVSVYPST